MNVSYDPTKLTAAEADGDACVVCGRYFTAADVPSAPVGMVDGGQVFACTSHTAAESDFKPGEVIRITLEGTVKRMGGPGFVVLNAGGMVETIPYQGQGITIERVAPAEWPPRAGDLWRDRRGHLHFAAYYAPDYDNAEDSRGVNAEGLRVVLLPQGVHEGTIPGHQVFRPENVVLHLGPLTLVHREDEQNEGGALR